MVRKPAKYFLEKHGVHFKKSLIIAITEPPLKSGFSWMIAADSA